MTNEKTGGPAYPVTKGNGFGYEYTVPGNLTLLDHFAGLAMQELMEHYPTTGIGPRDCASSAYTQAAAMIAERNRIMNEKP